MLVVAPILLAVLMRAAVYFIIEIAQDYELFGVFIPYVLMINHSILFIMVLAALKVQGLSLADIGWRVHRPIATSATAGLAIGAVLFIVQRALTIPVLEYAGLFERWSQWPGLPYIVSATLFAGVTEEALFRGYGITALERWLGKAGAVLVTTALFVALHHGQGPAGMINASVLGLILGVVFARRRDLLAVMIGHAVANLLFVLSMYFNL